MAWDAIGAIGEILGALAVVATLAYLAVQVRFAKKVVNHLLSKRGLPGILRLVKEQSANWSR